MSAAGVAIMVLLLVASTSAPALAEGPVVEGVPSFGESPGCGALDGVGGPRMATTGFQLDSTPVYGPWGDFFGRTIGDVRSQLQKVYLPGQVPDDYVWVHQRALPAIQQVIDNLDAEAAAGNTYPISVYTWSFNPITIPPTTKLSYHGIGAAIDINSNTNPYSSDNILITDMIDPGADNPYWFIDAWRDAGWCWGGDWQTIKDPMHFSWMGPIHTPGYDTSAFPPLPPRVLYSNYSNIQSSPEVDYDVVFSAAATPTGPYFVVDVDADGAADVVWLREGKGGVTVLEVARARHRYTRSDAWATTATAPTDPAAPVNIADVTGDARPDLVYLLQQPDGTLALEVFPLIQHGVLQPEMVATSVPATAGDIYLFDDFDLDGASDLYVVRPGQEGMIEVWMGPDFATTAATVQADLPADSLYATGDRDFDGSADLYVLSAAGGLRIMIGADPAFGQVGSIGSGNLVLDPTGEQLFVDDLDGDGHPDLLLVDADGDLRMRRGGFSTHDPGVWFVVESEITFELPPAPVRVAGADRYATAVAASQVSHPDGADVVYVAVGTNFPDAVAAGPAAAAEGAPILLVQSNALPNQTRIELGRLAPSRVVVLGGSAAIADSVVVDIQATLPGSTITRRAGSNRYLTAVEVSKAVFGPGVGTVFVASGETFSDALVAAPSAVAAGGPLLLVPLTSLPDAVRYELERLDPARIVIVGGQASVSSSVEQQLGSIAPVERIGGANRFSVAAAVSAATYPAGAATVYVAVGTTYPDALAAGPLTGGSPGPLLLVETDSLPWVIAQELERLNPHAVVVIGGPVAVSDAVVALVASYQELL
jgi:putative cell wall-binding protein